MSKKNHEASLNLARNRIAFSRPTAAAPPPPRSSLLAVYQPCAAPSSLTSYLLLWVDQSLWYEVKDDVGIIVATHGKIGGEPDASATNIATIALEEGVGAADQMQWQ